MCLAEGLRVNFVGPSVWAIGDSDPLFSYVKLLYHFDGNWDSALPGGDSLTPSSGATFTGSGQFGSAGDFSASTDSLAIGPSGSAAFGSTDDFCFEFWFYNPNAVGAASGIFNFVRGGSGSSLKAEMSGTSFWMSFGPYTSSFVTLAKLAWHHVALTRKAGTVRLWVDGALQHTGGSADTQDYAPGGTLFMGRNTAASSGAKCIVDDLRFTAGPAGSGAHRYDSGSSTYAIPTRAFPNG